MMKVLKSIGISRNIMNFNSSIFIHIKTKILVQATNSGV